jgi:hypothetical protein
MVVGDDDAGRCGQGDVPPNVLLEPSYWRTLLQSCQSPYC